MSSRHHSHHHRHEHFYRGASARRGGVWVAPYGVGLPQQCAACGGLGGHDPGCPAELGTQGTSVGDSGSTGPGADAGSAGDSGT